MLQDLGARDGSGLQRWVGCLTLPWKTPAVLGRKKNQVDRYLQGSIVPALGVWRIKRSGVQQTALGRGSVSESHTGPLRRGRNCSAAKRWKSIPGRGNRLCKGWKVWRHMLPSEDCKAVRWGWWVGRIEQVEGDGLEKTCEAGNQERGVWRDCEDTLFKAVPFPVDRALLLDA